VTIHGLRLPELATKLSQIVRAHPPARFPARPLGQPQRRAFHHATARVIRACVKVAPGAASQVLDAGDADAIKKLVAVRFFSKQTGFEETVRARRDPGSGGAASAAQRLAAMHEYPVSTPGVPVRTL
jgi:hypothetical protein